MENNGRFPQLFSEIKEIRQDCKSIMSMLSSYERRISILETKNTNKINMIVIIERALAILGGGILMFLFKDLL